MRGGRTTDEARVVSPALSSSFGTVWNGRRGAVHRFGDIFVHEIDHELMREPDVAGSVLRHAILPVTRTNANNRRLGAEDVEKAEWGSIDVARRVDGRYPGNRSRNDQRNQNGI